jgi:hypothetical protein
MSLALFAGFGYPEEVIQTKGVEMAFYDAPALRYDSAARYDVVSPSQQGKKAMAKVKLGLRSLNPDGIVALANTIKTAMTANANFTTPNPALTALGTLITTAQTKIAAYNTAKAAAELALTDRDTAVAALCAGLTQEAAYVENVSGGDTAKIESAGMSVRADAAPVGPPTQALNLVLSAGDNEGPLDGSWDPVRGANSYEIQTSPEPVTGTSWAYKMTAGKSSATLTGLTSGTRMWVRVRAIGADNATGPWSDPAVKTVP